MYVVEAERGRPCLATDPEEHAEGRRIGSTAPKTAGVTRGSAAHNPTQVVTVGIPGTITVVGEAENIILVVGVVGTIITAAGVVGNMILARGVTEVELNHPVLLESKIPDA